MLKSFTAKIKKVRAGIIAAFCAAMAAPVFAVDVPDKMDTIANNVVEILRSPFVRVILACMLCAAAIGYGMNKDNEKMKQTCIAIAIATAIILGATGLMTIIWGE